MNYPPNNGAVPGTEVNITLKQGQVLGRYGKVGPKSNFVTYPGASSDQLALPPTTDPSTYTEFIVTRDIPDAIRAKIMPWGGSLGGGIQYELPKPIVELLKEGYLDYY